MEMTEETMLAILKQDLQIITSANDDFLKLLLREADAFIQREGIKPEETAEYCGIKRQYAAYLFRKRSGDETRMPRFLRWEMNNLLFHQKAKRETK